MFLFLFFMFFFYKIGEQEGRTYSAWGGVWGALAPVGE
jgi:drug/metabolite transporter superfamily protein YnfA